MVSGIDPSELRAARERAGLTQHELARLVGAAGGERISRWELGSSEPRADFLVRLAQTLEIPTMRLVRFDGDVADLRALRLGAGLSAVELAAAANLAAPTYYAWEQGRWARLPDRSVIDALGRGLNQPTDTVTAAFAEAQRSRRQHERRAVGTDDQGPT
ncbi:MULTISPECIES: helix-turn-helix domain-containing protein [Actinomycetes]|jgi:transcriptional regulator with XRE-family HTH domain